MNKIKQPLLFPGDEVWEITSSIEPRKIIVSNIEYFIGGLHYNIKNQKTSMNWFDNSYIDIMDERDSYPAAAVWTTREKLLESYIYLSRKKNQCEEKIKELTNKQ